MKYLLAKLRVKHNLRVVYFPGQNTFYKSADLSGFTEWEHALLRQGSLWAVQQKFVAFLHWLRDNCASKFETLKEAEQKLLSGVVRRIVLDNELAPNIV